MAIATYRYFGTYGVAKDVYFASEDPTDVNDLYIGTAWAAGDGKISKDGGAEASTTNTPAQITSFHHKLTVTATEMQASEVFITIRDQTEPEVFLPVVVHITNRLTLGSLAIDTTAIGGNVAALTLQGVGTQAGLKSTGGATGHGINGIGGATTGNGLEVTGGTSGIGINATGTGGSTGHGILGTASASAGYGIRGSSANSSGIIGAGGGNGFAGIEATGSGTGCDGLKATSSNANAINAVSTLTGYGLKAVGTTADLNTNIFDTLEGSEPTGAIASNASFKQIFQYLKRRYFNYNTQTSSTQITRKDDSTTTLQTRTSSDDGTTQTLTKAV